MGMWQFLSAVNTQTYWCCHCFENNQCLAEPRRAQYGGGIIVNPGFDHNIEGWTVFGKGAIKERISNGGNRFIVAHNRTHPLDSFSQKVQLKKGMLYTFSGNFTFSIVELYDISFTSIHLMNVPCWSLFF